MKWKNIQINIQNIEGETEKATLIKMPNKSNYSGYSFWHPTKLIRRGNNSYAISLGYTDEFSFKLKKYGKGKWNKSKIIDEIEISVAEFEKAFKSMEDSCQSQKEGYLEITEPNKIDKDVTIEKELLNEK